MARFAMMAWNGNSDSSYECVGSSDDLLMCLNLRTDGNWYVHDTRSDLGGLVDNVSFATFMESFVFKSDVADLQSRLDFHEKRYERLQEGYNRLAKEKSDALKELDETKDQFWSEQNRANDLEAKVRLLASACRNLSDVANII